MTGSRVNNPSERGVEVSRERVAIDVLDSLLEGCQVIGFDFRYVYVNEAAATQGRKSVGELVGKAMTEVYPGIEETAAFAMVQRCMADRQHHRLENEFIFPDGSKGWFQLRFIPVPEGTCILSLDVTQQKRTAMALARSEEQLRHAHKMDAIGRFAGGIAHDINNLLSVVLSYSTAIVEELPSVDPLRLDIEEIKKAGERMAELMRQLLAFSRQQVIKAQIVDVNEVIRNMQRMIGRLVGEHIEVRVALAKDLGMVSADVGHIEQVILNLAVNARDAMPTGGLLTLETQNVDLDASYAEEHLGVTQGKYVMLAVSDTGIGMDRATRERIFEPFFTTKERGKGTGLGLSIVFGIVQQSGGTIWVYSEPGKGATFKIYLPRVVGAAEPKEAPLARVGGSETILLVEDEDQVRLVAREILKRHGYKVLDARNGAEALLLSETHDGEIHVLLTDVVMPQMNGREVAEQLKLVRPGLRIVFMSGFTAGAIEQSFLLSTGASFLQKPLTPDALLREIRQVLDCASGG